MLVGTLARSRLCTQANVYRLEGPLALGGQLPMFCELCSVPLLMALALSSLRPRAGTPVRIVAAIAFAMWVASRHHLNLANNSNIDSLFIFTYVLEFITSLLFLGCALMKSGCETDDSKCR